MVIMEETMVFLLLVIVMLVGSYLAGSIPLAVTMSEAKLQLVSVLGAGLLVGTALAVIIPEGVRSLGSGQQVIHAHLHTPATKDGTISVAVGPENHDEGGTDIHSLIGISLVLGFVFMLLVDQCSAARSRDVEGGSKERNITATLGLVVHAAADGIALGAAATTAQADVEMIVFMAIMLHKAPAAFGLVTFLLHEGIERSRIRRHLLVFSLSAPTLAVVTYFGIGQEGKETLSSFNATGIAMLFSAGTFLYVATVHVLPELTSRSHHHSSAGSTDAHVAAMSGKELTCLVFGALMPLLLAVGHHH